MSEFKISCTNCGQHIAADESWCGRKVNCPTCQAELVIPSLAAAAPPPPAGPRMSLPVAAAPAPPPPLYRPTAPPPPAGGGQLCNLAPISLVVVLGSLPLALVVGLFKIPFPIALLPHVCLVAGLVCAHTALRRIRRDRALRGKVYAIISLVFGYLMVVFIVATIGVAIAFKQGWVQPPDLQRRNQVFPNRPMSPPLPPGLPGTQPTRPTPGRPRPGGPGLQPAPVTAVPSEAETSTLPINNTVSGTLAGQAFRCDAAVMQGNMTLELKEGTDFIPDRSLTIFPFIKGEMARLSSLRHRVVEPRRTFMCAGSRTGSRAPRSFPAVTRCGWSLDNGPGTGFRASSS